MFAKQPRALAPTSPKREATASRLAGIVGQETAPKGILAGGVLTEEERLLDGFAGFCLLPAGLEPEGKSPPFPGSVAVRHGLVERWLTVIVASRGAISEAALMAWLDRAPAEAQGREALCRWLTGDASRVLPCGAALLYAPAAAAAVRWPAVRTFRAFYAFSSMDRGVERAVSGLLASLVAQAVVAHPFRAGLGAWLSSFGGRLFRDLRRVSFAGTDEEAEVERQTLEVLEDVLWEVAERFTGRDPAAMTAAELLEEVQTFPWFQGRSDPEGARSLTVLALLTAALELGGENPRTALRLLDGLHEMGRVARCLAAGLLGAWYGRQGLEDVFEAEVERGEDRLWREQRLQVSAHGALLREVSWLLELPDSLQPVASEIAGPQFGLGWQSPAGRL